MTPHDHAIHDLRQLLAEMSMAIEFSPDISENYARGYVTGRLDVITHVDAVVSSIIVSLSGHEPVQAPTPLGE